MAPTTSISIAEIDDDAIRFTWRKRVVRDARLTHSELRVLLELESYANEDGTNAHPGVNLISVELGINEKTVRRALKHGEELGYVIKTQAGRRGRGRNFADVFALSLPKPDGLPDSQMSGNSVEPEATTGHSDVRQSSTWNPSEWPSTTGHFGSTTGHLGTDCRTSSDEYRTTGCPPTSSYPPDPSTPVLSTPSPVVRHEVLSGEVLDESISVGVADRVPKDVSSDMAWFRTTPLYDAKDEKRFGELVTSGVSRMAAASQAYYSKEQLPPHLAA